VWALFNEGAQKATREREGEMWEAMCTGAHHETLEKEREEGDFWKKMVHGATAERSAAALRWNSLLAGAKKESKAFSGEEGLWAKMAQGAHEAVLNEKELALWAQMSQQARIVECQPEVQFWQAMCSGAQREMRSGQEAARRARLSEPMAIQRAEEGEFWKKMCTGAQRERDGAIREARRRHHEALAVRQKRVKILQEEEAPAAAAAGERRTRAESSIDQPEVPDTPCTASSSTVGGGGGSGAAACEGLVERSPLGAGQVFGEGFLTPLGLSRALVVAGKESSAGGVRCLRLHCPRDWFTEGALWWRCRDRVNPRNDVLAASQAWELIQGGTLEHAASGSRFPVAVHLQSEEKKLMLEFKGTGVNPGLSGGGSSILKLNRHGNVDFVPNAQGGFARFHYSHVYPEDDHIRLKSEAMGRFGHHLSLTGEGDFFGKCEASDPLCYWYLREEGSEETSIVARDFVLGGAEKASQQAESEGISALDPLTGERVLPSVVVLSRPGPGLEADEAERIASQLASHTGAVWIHEPVLLTHPPTTAAAAVGSGVFLPSVPVVREPTPSGDPRGILPRQAPNAAAPGNPNSKPATPAGSTKPCSRPTSQGLRENSQQGSVLGFERARLSGGEVPGPPVSRPTSLGERMAMQGAGAGVSEGSGRLRLEAGDGAAMEAQLAGERGLVGYRRRVGECGGVPGTIHDLSVSIAEDPGCKAAGWIMQVTVREEEEVEAIREAFQAQGGAVPRFAVLAAAAGGGESGVGPEGEEATQRVGGRNEGEGIISDAAWRRVAVAAERCFGSPPAPAADAPGSRPVCRTELVASGSSLVRMLDPWGYKQSKRWMAIGSIFTMRIRFQYMQLVWATSQVWLFTALRGEEQEKLLDSAETVYLLEDEEVTSRGEVGAYLYVVIAGAGEAQGPEQANDASPPRGPSHGGLLAGRLDSHLPGLKGTTLRGIQVTNGDVLGEGALLESGRYTETVVAMGGGMECCRVPIEPWLLDALTRPGGATYNAKEVARLVQPRPEIPTDIPGSGTASRRASPLAGKGGLSRRGSLRRASLACQRPMGGEAPPGEQGGAESGQAHPSVGPSGGEHDAEWGPFDEGNAAGKAPGGEPLGDRAEGAWGAMTGMVSDFLDNDELKAKQKSKALEAEALAADNDSRIQSILDKAREIFKGLLYEEIGALLSRFVSNYRDERRLALWRKRWLKAFYRIRNHRRTVRAIMVNKRESWTRSKQDCELIMDVLCEAPLLSHMPYQACFDIAKSVTLEKRDPDINPYLWRMNSLCDRMYFLISGRVRLTDREGKIRGEYRQGETFGQASLAAGKGGQSFDCECLEACTFAAIHRSQFVQHVKPEMERFVRPQVKFLESCAPLQGCTGDDFFALALAVDVVKLGAGEDFSQVMTNAETGEYRQVVTFLMEGLCKVVRQGRVFQSNKRMSVAVLGPGEMISAEMFTGIDADRGMSVRTKGECTLCQISTRELSNTRSASLVHESMRRYIQTKKRMWQERTQVMLETLEKALVPSRLVPLSTTQERPEHSQAPRSESTPPVLQGAGGGCGLLGPKPGMATTVDRLDKFAATSHLEMGQLGIMASLGRSDLSLQAPAGGGMGGGGGEYGSPEKQMYSWDGLIGAGNASPEPGSGGAAGSSPAGSRSLLQPCASYSSYGDMCAGHFGNSEKHKPKHLIAKIDAQRAMSDPAALLIEKERIEELARVEAERAARTTLAPLWDHSLEGPVHIKSYGSLNAMMRRKDALRGDAMGATEEEIRSYTDQTRAKRMSMLSMGSHTVPTQCSLIDEGDPRNQVPWRNPHFTKVPSAMATQPEVYHGGIGRPPSLLERDPQSWNEKVGASFRRRMDRSIFDQASHGGKNFGTHFDECRVQNKVGMPEKRVLGEHREKSMALQDAIRSTSDDATHYAHEHHPPGLYNGSPGTRLCYICGPTKRYVREVEKKKVAKAKSFFEEEAEFARAANRPPPRDPLLMSHSKAALRLFGTIGKEVHRVDDRPRLLTEAELKALTAEKRHFLGSAASSVKQQSFR